MREIDLLRSTLTAERLRIDPSAPSGAPPHHWAGGLAPPHAPRTAPPLIARAETLKRHIARRSGDPTFAAASQFAQQARELARLTTLALRVARASAGTAPRDETPEALELWIHRLERDWHALDDEWTRWHTEHDLVAALIPLLERCAQGPLPSFDEIRLAARNLIAAATRGEGWLPPACHAHARIGAQPLEGPAGETAATRRALAANAVACAVRTVRLLAGAGALEDQLEEAVVAAFLRDVGLLSLPPRAEVQSLLLRHHPALSAFVVDRMRGAPHRLAEAVHQHHERLDGSGYPVGLRGPRIGRLARVLAVADAWNALGSESQDEDASRLLRHAAEGKLDARWVARALERIPTETEARTPASRVTTDQRPETADAPTRSPRPVLADPRARPARRRRSAA